MKLVRWAAGVGYAARARTWYAPHPVKRRGFCSSWLLVVPAALACSSQGGVAPADDDTYLGTDRGRALPQRLSDFGLFEDWEKRQGLHSSAHRYVPRFPLWTNGSDKERFVSLPWGSQIEVSGRGWTFPVGTLFFKGFSYEMSGGPLVIETRVIRIDADGVTYGAYLWDETGADAQLLDGKSIERVPVEAEGDSFEHSVPNRLQCRMCHESAEDPILGFDALRLDIPSEGGAETQLQSLVRKGLFRREPEPVAFSAEGRLGEVLGYLEGNCVHCHNGGEGANASFDLRADVAVENLVGVETSSELLHGVRVVAGSPEDSVLYQALLAEPSAMDSQAMPPLGVQRRDDESIQMIRDWILDLK